MHGSNNFVSIPSEMIFVNKMASTYHITDLLHKTLSTIEGSARVRTHQ